MAMKLGKLEERHHPHIFYQVTCPTKLVRDGERARIVDIIHGPKGWHGVKIGHTCTPTKVCDLEWL